jgi:predicted MFS family arabinose efflux permease
MTDNSGAQSSELAIVVVLALGLGLVGIDRFLISTMFPAIARDLHMGYGDIGIIAGALSIAWGVAALFMGNMADRVGNRTVLVGSLVVFSLLIGTSGLARGLLGLVLVRVMMGFADGAFTPASISATIHASPPERHGRNCGLSQMTLSLFGLGLSPLIVAALLNVVSWRWIFLIFLAPGLLIAWFTWRIVPRHEAVYVLPVRSSIADWRAVVSYRDVRVLMPLMLCWLTCTITTSAFMPSYLVDHLKLSELQMGTVMSSIGFGAAVGTLTLLWLSDKIGRKPVMLLATLGTLASLLTLNSLGPRIPLLFAALFMVHFFNNAAITLTVGPICAESVNPALMTTAAGVIIAVGELLGGGLAPIVSGQFAERFGIDQLQWLPVVILVGAFFLCLLLKETRSTSKGEALNAVNEAPAGRGLGRLPVGQGR